MKWSVRDESLHSKMGCQLFSTYVHENNQLLDLCREDVIKAAEAMVNLENIILDKMFEMGDIEGISANDLKHFIKKRTNEKLVELGYVDLGNYFAYDDKAAVILIGFIILPGALPILIFLRLGRRIIPKRVRMKIMKIFGKLKTKTK